jgi:hypothetical protein
MRQASKRIPDSAEALVFVVGLLLLFFLCGIIASFFARREITNRR